jgi:hypothetical protein
MQRRYLVLFVLLAAALAQAPADQKPATVEGTVANSVTHAPLRRVELTLSNGEMSPDMAAMVRQFGSGSSAPQLPQVTTKTLATVTDAAGRFRFDQVPAGTWRLKAEKPGFAEGHYPLKTGSLRVTAGQEMAHIDIRLVPYGTLSGRVLDEDGEPFPTAMVSALSYSFVSGHRRLMPVDAAQTNNRGEFSLARIPPGHYFLSASVSRMGFSTSIPAPPADGAPETAYVSTYLPNTLDAADAQKVDVTVGAEVSGLNIQLRKSLVVRVKGRLVDASGDPMTAAHITLVGSNLHSGSMSSARVDDPEGKFEIANVPPGAYTAMTMQMKGSRPWMNLQPLVVPDRNVENVELGVSPETTIRGKIAVEGDTKTPDEFPVILTSETMGVMPVNAKADKSGAFAFEHVARASYDLMLPLSPEGTYLKSVLFNDRESLGRSLDCSAVSTATLRIVLGTDGGKVEARVSRDDKPAPDATVVLLPSDPNRRYPQTVRTGSSDASGHLTLKDVPPGDYLAFAWEEVETGLWFDPEFVKAQTQGVRVQIGPKATEQVDLTPIPAAQ